MASTSFSVGLTGGIGSGKSLIANMLAKKGAAIVDTDHIAHQLTGVGGGAMAAICEQFGDAYLTSDGAMDRAKMRALVFTDPAARRRLESILHPMIRNETARAAEHAHGDYLLIVVPLLVESGSWKDQVSRILVVDCPEELQIKRVVQRNGLSAIQVRAIMASQATREARRMAADDVIMNDGNVESLAPEIDRLHILYTSLAKAAKAP